mgnify:FL=1
MTEPSKDQKLKSISFKFRGAYVHEKTYGGGSAVAERIRKKDNNIIIPTHLIISQKDAIIGRK